MHRKSKKQESSSVSRTVNVDYALLGENEMTEFYTRKVKETAKRWSLRVKNSSSIKRVMTDPTGEFVIINTLKNQKDTAKMEKYNDNRREYLAISALFAIGLFLQIISHAIL